MSRRTRRPAGRRRTAPFQPGPLPEPLAVDRLSHDGRGIARWRGKTLFVAGALPGETVRVRLYAEQRRYAEGEVLERLSEASERQRPPCGHYAECGGCQLQHMRPDDQVAFKERALLEQLWRTSRIRPRSVAPAIGSHAAGYRSRARLGVWSDRSGTVTLGFRRRRRRELVAVTHCEVLDPALNALIGPLQAWLSGLETRGAISHIELLSAQEGPALVLREVKPLTDADRRALRQHLPTLPPERLWRQTARRDTLLDWDGRACDPRLSYTLPDWDLTLGFHPQDFVQINAAVNRRMVRQAVDWLAPRPGETVLDLFCGVGNFTLPLARAGARVLGLEGSGSMVARGEENARRNGLTATFARADLADPAARLGPEQGRLDAALLDPPRDGARALLPALVQRAPDRLVYVSCNPSTLARDAGALAAAGYGLQSVGVLDMFPHTEHVESMALFVRH